MKNTPNVMPQLLSFTAVCLIVIAGLATLNNIKPAPAARPKPTRNISSEIRTKSGRVVPIQILTPQGQGFTIGSGVMITLPSKQTGILTNAHVCKAAGMFGTRTYTTVDGSPVYDLQVIKFSPNPDLCMLISNSLLNHPSFNLHVTDYAYGDELLEIGFPLNGPQTPTLGYYLIHSPETLVADSPEPNGSCVDGKPPVTVYLNTYCLVVEDLESTSVITYPGNSGSPVFNSQGELVGLMNSADNQTNRGNFIGSKHIAEFIKGL